MKKGRAVSLALDRPTGPPLHPYQILSKYSKGIKVMERTRMHLQMDRWIANPLNLFGQGDKQTKLIRHHRTQWLSLVYTVYHSCSTLNTSASSKWPFSFLDTCRLNVGSSNI